LLSNAVLNKLDWFLQERAKHGFAMEKARRDGAPNLRFARYADDWCVFLTRANKRYAESLRDEIREFLSRIAGLSLSMEKTCITHVQEGFDFLGFHLERGIGMDGKPVPKIKIGQKAKANARLRASPLVSDVLRQSSGAGPTTLRLHTTSQKSRHRWIIRLMRQRLKRFAENTVSQRNNA
jgi:hypothetical protein